MFCSDPMSGSHFIVQTNKFLLIDATAMTLGQGHIKVTHYIFPDPYIHCAKYLRFSWNGFDVRGKSFGGGGRGRGRGCGGGNEARGGGTPSLRVSRYVPRFCPPFSASGRSFCPPKFDLVNHFIQILLGPISKPPFSACRRPFCLQIWPNLSFYSDLVGSHFELRAVHPYWFWPGVPPGKRTANIKSPQTGWLDKMLTYLQR